MNIIKKNLKVENFDPEKMIISIINAAIDAKEPLTQSDINIIKKRIISRLKLLRNKNGNTSSYEIKGIIIEVLQEYSFINVLIAYLDYEC